MGLYVQLGFATELFESDEAMGAYWYWTYLLQLRLHLKSALVTQKANLRKHKASVAADAASQVGCLGVLLTYYLYVGEY